MTDVYQPIGDKDPEDAYDADDPPAERLAVLERVVADLRAHRDERFEARRTDALRVLFALGRVRGVDAARLQVLRNELEQM